MYWISTKMRMSMNWDNCNICHIIGVNGKYDEYLEVEKFTEFDLFQGITETVMNWIRADYVRSEDGFFVSNPTNFGGFGCKV